MNTDAEQGVEQLWKYQLRREHASLLDAFNAQKVNIRQMEERVNALDAQIHKVMSAHSQLAHDVTSRINDLADFRKAEEKIKSELQVLAERIDRFRDRSAEPGENSTVVGESSETAPEVPSSPTPGKISQPQSSGPINEGPKHVTNAGPRRSKRLLREDLPGSPTFASLPDPPLTQDGRPIEVFVEFFDNLSPTIAPCDQKQLAAMFITGLDKRKQQDLVVSGLEKKKKAKIHDNKQVEVRCAWDDVRKELERCGILSSQEKAPEKKKRKL